MPSMRWGRCGFQSRRQGHRRSCSPRHEITPWGTPDARKIKTSPASTPMCLTYGASIAFGCDCPPGYGYRALCLLGGGKRGRQHFNAPLGSDIDVPQLQQHHHHQPQPCQRPSVRGGAPAGDADKTPALLRPGVPERPGHVHPLAVRAAVCLAVADRRAGQP